MASTQHQRVEEKVYGILGKEDLIDDSTGVIPMRGLKTELSLKDRFARRLSKMLGAETDIQQANNDNTINIYLTRSRPTNQVRISLNNELRKFVQAMEAVLASIAKNADGPQHELQIACDELWDVVLIFNRSKIELIIQRLKKIFEDYQTTYVDLVARMFGIDDVECKHYMLDRELGDRIISLSQQINSYDGSMEELDTLVHTASEMTRVLLHLRERLRSLLQRTLFADGLYDLICTLGFPERVHHTMVRSARASKVFEHVKFHFRPSSPRKAVSFAVSTKSSMRPNAKKPLVSPQRQEKLKL
ncbi:unnamed protein product [Alternaria alternata]